ncbi:DUF7674 family protein [Jidongwangia harbinensis]|uniref:DUF7674 family protein n=1 Tax=Jidongwangia harbinensis TaxID=2878561 RepID=UPI001CD96A00|nr:hypothetical protein [Jidongwangia harbinensis]MCA2217640.1 hypothetical protein [Jidongwangia harbinensis]
MDTGEVLVRELVDRFGPLRPIHAEHLAENGGAVLPHVLFWDLTQAVVDAFLRPEAPLDWRTFLDVLDRAYDGGDAYLRGIVEVSFLENLPFPAEPGHGIVDSLPPGLRTIFDRVRPAG